MKKGRFISLAIITAVGAAFLFSAEIKIDLSNPKASIATQFELLKASKTAALRECFTDRLKESITDQSVAKGKAEASSYTLADLVHKVEMGKGSAKIKMKNGRTLTVLIEKNGKWYADTIWFR
ncbi:MAG: hypothetical protein AABZ39_10170 [Spirochaetota bacterium]